MYREGARNGEKVGVTQGTSAFVALEEAIDRSVSWNRFIFRSRFRSRTRSTRDAVLYSSRSARINSARDSFLFLYSG